MPPAFLTCIGVNTSPGRIFTYIALDADRKLLAVGSGTTVDVLSFAFGQESAILALSPLPRPYRTVLTQPESGLVAVGDLLPTPPARRPEEALAPPAACPFWLRSAYALASQLEAFGFRAFPAGEDAPLQWLETQCESAFHQLLGQPPFPHNTLEGRIQRQLVLEDLGLDVPDAMQFFEEVTRYRWLRGIIPGDKVLSQPELNAWLAAQVAWLAANDATRLRPITPQQERCIYLPLPEINQPA